MKIIREELLLDRNSSSISEDWDRILTQIREAIRSIEWPRGSGKFMLHDQSGKKRGEGSGVKPIKEACMLKLKDFGWDLETTLDIGTYKRPGALDATCKVGDRHVALEWETGNVSSSHRALNKMCLGLMQEKLVAGVLIVPTRKMYSYLTDRVGNFPEIEPYFPLWKAVPIKSGLLMIIAIEHDGVSKDVPRIEKGTDGRALI